MNLKALTIALFLSEAAAVQLKSKNKFSLGAWGKMDLGAFNKPDREVRLGRNGMPVDELVLKRFTNEVTASMGLYDAEGDADQTIHIEEFLASISTQLKADGQTDPAHIEDIIKQLEAIFAGSDKNGDYHITINEAVVYMYEGEFGHDSAPEEMYAAMESSVNAKYQDLLDAEELMFMHDAEGNRIKAGVDALGNQLWEMRQTGHTADAIAETATADERSTALIAAYNEYQGKYELARAEADDVPTEEHIRWSNAWFDAMALAKSDMEADRDHRIQHLTTLQNAAQAAYDANEHAMEELNKATTEHDQLQGEMDAYVAELEEATTAADEAKAEMETAHTAKTAAETAYNTADNAAKEAQLAHDDAVEDAATAATDEQNAHDLLEAAKKELEDAQTAEALALTALTEAESKLDSAESAADAAQTALDDAKAALEAAQNAVNEYQKLFDETFL